MGAKDRTQSLRILSDKKAKHSKDGSRKVHEGQTQVLTIKCYQQTLITTSITFYATVTKIKFKAVQRKKMLKA